MRVCVLACFAWAAAAAAHGAEPPPLSAYGSLPAIEDAELSPDGSKLAFITVVGQERALTVQEIGAGKMMLAARIGNTKVRDIRFASDRHLLVTTSVVAQPSVHGWRMHKTEWAQAHSHNLVTGKTVTLMSRTEDTLNTVFGEPSPVTTGTGQAALVRGWTLTSGGRQDLYRVDLDKGRGEIASQGVPGHIMDWVSGPEGQLLARSRYAGAKGSWALDVRDGAGWRTVDTSKADLDAPALLGIGRDGRSVILARDTEGGVGLLEVSLDSGAASVIETEAGEADAYFHPKTQRLAGIGKRTDAGPEIRFFDPAMAAAWTTVRRAFQGKRVRPVSWAHDLSRVVVETQGRDDPGSIYFVNLKSLRAEFIGDMHPDVPGAMIGEVRPVTYKAADGLEIRGFLTLPPGRTPKNLPLVVLPHGGPQAQTDLQFDWWAQALASRGYAVLQPNFRGSSGRGMAFVQAGYGEWGRKMQTDLSDGVRWLAGQGLADPKRVCIAGGSYGGYAALAGAAIDTGVYRCAVSVNGVSDLRTMLASAAERAGERAPALRYWKRFMGVDRRSDRALDEVSPARQASKVGIPVLLIHGRDDTVVPYRQSQLMDEGMRRAGKDVKLVTLEGEDHWLSRGETRQRMLDEAVAFIQKHNPAS